MSKTAIITGGSRGIGEAMVMRLAEMGYNVVINFRSDSSKALCDAIIAKVKETTDVDALAVQADVSKYEDCKKLVDATIEKFGAKIDVLVNNAGITNNSNFIDIKPEDYVNLINVNLVALLHMCHLTIPHMLDHDSLVCNISSVGGLTGVVNQADYCATKSGVIGLSRALALEFAPRKVRVNVIAPGMIMTDMLRGVNQTELNALAGGIPLGKIGHTEDIAGALEYLVGAKYSTGQVISPNGGFVLQ